MRMTTWMGVLCVIGAVANGACGGDTGGTGGTGGHTATTTAAGTGGTGGAGPTLLNGCDPSKAEDQTSESTAMVMFPVGGLNYSPACMKIKAGNKVMFMGDLAAHPLRAGEIKDGTPAPDASSPIKSTNAGMMVTFAFPTAGAYPYYCNVNEPSMAGVVFVE